MALKNHYVLLAGHIYIQFYLHVYFTDCGAVSTCEKQVVFGDLLSFREMLSLLCAS